MGGCGDGSLTLTTSELLVHAAEAAEAAAAAAAEAAEADPPHTHTVAGGEGARPVNDGR